MNDESATDYDTIVRQSFPLFYAEDYDFGFKRPRYPVGLKSTYPEELVKRIAAAVVSYQGGLAGMDYAYKRYVADRSYALNDGSRLDLRVAATLGRAANYLDNLVKQLPDPEKHLGRFVSEWTLLRVPFAVTFLTSCCHRGAFFEVCTLTRSLLEQVCWATTISKLNDADAIRMTSATRAISAAKNVAPHVGRLYGWLSVHAHWAYDGHVKALKNVGDRSTMIFASTHFKMRAMMTVVVATVTVLDVVLASKASLLVSQNALSARDAVLKVKSELLALALEIGDCDPNDEDTFILEQMLYPHG